MTGAHQTHGRINVNIDELVGDSSGDRSFIANSCERDLNLGDE